MRLGVGIQGNVKGAVKYLAKIAEQLEDSGPVLAEIADALRDASRRQFDSGDGWRKLKPETIKRKRSSKILVMSGDLRDSFVRAGSPNAKLKITEDSVSIGTSLGYAIFQGKGRSPSRVDKRRTEETIAEIYDRHIQRLRG